MEYSTEMYSKVCDFLRNEYFGIDLSVYPNRQNEDTATNAMGVKKGMQPSYLLNTAL